MHDDRNQALALAAERLPNFLFLGPDKSGSTWIYHLLDRHPDAFMVPGKGLYYFSSHFDRGAEWYLSFFQDAGKLRVRGEVSHNYLSCAAAPARIHAFSPKMRLMVCLREPADRAFSAYLHALKNGRYAEPTSFEEALETDPTLRDHGRYATHLREFDRLFPRDQLLVTLFDDLKSNPQSFADQICDFLDLERFQLDAKSAEKMMPAGRPRLAVLVKAAKTCSHTARKLGLRRLRGRIKTTRWIRNLLYVPFEQGAQPVMQAETKKQLREFFRPEVEELERTLVPGILQRWDYGEAG